MEFELNREEALFRDQTLEPFTCIYPYMDQMDGHTFRHIGGGMYHAEPEFEIDPEQAQRMLADYSEVELYVKIPESCRGGSLQVVYAYAPRYAQQYTISALMGNLRDLFPELHKHGECWRNLVPVSYRGSDDEEEEKDGYRIDRWYRRHPKCRAFQWVPPRENGGRRIALGSVIGEKIDEGIYYVHDPRRHTFGDIVFSPVLPELGDVEYDDLAKTGEVSVIRYPDQGYEWDDSDVYVKYIAIGREHFDKLRHMAEIGEGVYLSAFQVAFFHPDFAGNDHGLNKKGLTDMQGETMEKSGSECIGMEISDNPEDGIPEDLISLPALPNLAMELRPGIGYESLLLRFKMITDGGTGETYADQAFLLGDKLILRRRVFGRIDEKEYPLGLMESLSVCGQVVLRCGEAIDVWYEVLSREKQMSKLLSPETYALYQRYGNLLFKGRET